MPSEARPVTGKWLTEKGLAAHVTRGKDRNTLRREGARPSEACPVVNKRVTCGLAPTTDPHPTWHLETRPVIDKRLPDKLASTVVKRPITDRWLQTPEGGNPARTYAPGTRVSFVIARPCGLEPTPAPRTDLVVASLSTEDETAADKGAGAQPRRGPQRRVGAHGPQHQAPNRALCCHNGGRRPAWRP